MTLIERLKAATGPDPDLDNDIAVELKQWPYDGSLETMDQNTLWFNTSYTASIDAALALVERMLPESGYMLTRGRCSPDEPLFGFQIYRSDFIQDDAGPEPIGLPSEHNSLPLAILTALFTAIQGKDAHADK